MKAFLAFFKKELLGSARSGKLAIMGILFFAFGVMNPAIAKLTPWLMEALSESLEGAGMTVTVVSVSALDSWAHFFKNIPLALVVFALLYGGSFTSEYASGTLVLLTTKGLARYKAVLAKTLAMLLVWTGSYFLSFGVTYLGNMIFWDNAIAKSLIASVVYFWLFGVFVIALIVLFSTVGRSMAAVLLGTGGSVFVLYLLGMIPKFGKWLPTELMSGTAIVYGQKAASEFVVATVVTAVLSAAAIVTSVILMNKKEI